MLGIACIFIAIAMYKFLPSWLRDEREKAMLLGDEPPKAWIGMIAPTFLIIVAALLIFRSEY